MNKITRTKIKLAAIAKWRDPEYRAKQLRAESTRHAWKADPKYRARMHRLSKLKWKDQTFRAKACERARSFARSNIWRRKVTLGVRKVWQDPVYKQKMARVAANRLQDPLVNSKRQEKMKKKWKDPTFRARMSLILSKSTSKKWANDPQFRARIAANFSKSAKRMWQSPAYRTKMAAQKSAIGLCRQSKQALTLKKFLGLSNVEVVKFGYSWDGAWTHRKTFFEYQGCYWHECPQCGHRGKFGGIPTKRDAKKLEVAKQHNWKVVYAWGHEYKQIIKNPRAWLAKHR